MYCASQFPKVEIDKISLTPATDNLYWVDVVLKNDRVYPTASDRAVQLKRAKKDKLMFSSSNNISLVKIPEGTTTIDPLNYSTRCKAITEKETEFRLKGKQSLRFRTLVKMTGASGWVEFNVKSFYGGKAKKRVSIRLSD